VSSHFHVSSPEITHQTSQGHLGRHHNRRQGKHRITLGFPVQCSAARSLPGLFHPTLGVSFSANQPAPTTIGGRPSQAEGPLRHHNIRLDEVLESRSDWPRRCLRRLCPPHGPETEAVSLKTKTPHSKNGSVSITGPIWSLMNSSRPLGLFRPRPTCCHEFLSLLRDKLRAVGALMRLGSLR